MVPATKLLLYVKIVATQLFTINFKARVFRRKRLVLLSPDLQSF